MITFVRNILWFSAIFFFGFVSGRIQPDQCKAYLEDGRRLMSYTKDTCRYVHPRLMEPVSLVRAK
jgi:hypothetical protein